MMTSGIESLSLSEFRGYENLTLHAGGRSVVLFGPNGAGKTNILEAISFLSPGRGLRRARLGEVLRQDTMVASWHVEARVRREREPPVLLASSAQIMPGKERRTGSIFGKKEKTLSAFGTYLNLSWVTPQMDRLFVDGAGERRRFLDRLCIALHPTHGDLLQSYTQGLEEWMQVCQQASHDHRWLDIIEDGLVTFGTQLVANREDVCLKLNSIMAQGVTEGPRIVGGASAFLSSFPRAFIHINGALEEHLATLTTEQAKAFYRDMLVRARAQAREKGGFPSIGPHRSKIEVIHTTKNMPSHLCSTGEQKVLLIAIMLAFAQLMKDYSIGVPVILLDEAVAHLDADRRQALFDELDHIGLQAWLSGTDVELFRGLEDRALFYHVENGTVTEYRNTHIRFLSL